MKPSNMNLHIKIGSSEYAATALFCTGVATFLWLIDNKATFLTNLIISFCVGLTIHILVNFTINALKQYSSLTQWIAIIIMLMFSSLLGLRLGFWIAGIDSQIPDGFMQTALMTSAPIGIIFGGFMIWFYYSKAKLHEAESFHLEFQLKNSDNEKQLSDAKLSLLQAQIEPHFLFNTLATVHSLIEEEPKRAALMLEHTNDYLRTALDHSRSQGCILQHELDLLHTYLDIMKMRMGKRLHVDFIVDDSVRNQPFPPMLLQPLVENAIKHGLEPKVEGGTLQISGMLKDGHVKLDIIDSGVGFIHFSGEGVGLSNVRERLQTLYDGKASFEIIELGTRGVCATIMIPLQTL